MKMSNLLTLLKVGADVKLSKEQAQHLADLIEKLQQRIAELERYNVRLANESHEKDLKIDELAATVDALRSALRHLAHNAKASGAEMGLALVVANEALQSTPQQNLNAVKREVLLGLLSTMTCSECTCDRHVEHYANQRYPDKDGE